MASVINLKFLNVNTPQQNAGAFFGETVMAGWDSNQKYNVAIDGTFGYLNSTFHSINTVIDGFELIDGAIMDSDNKSTLGGSL